MTAMLNKMRATAQKFKWLIFAVATVFFLIFPIIAKSSHIRLMTTALIYALTALGLMLIFGFTGMMCTGFAAFYGTGAYVTAIFSTKLDANFWVCMLLSGIITGIVGFIICLPCLRLSADFVGLLSTALLNIFLAVVRTWQGVTNGASGIVGIPHPVILGYEFKSKLDYYYLILIFVLIVYLLVRNILNSKVGLCMKGIRDNEIGTIAVGVKSRQMKLLTFTMGAFIGGLAGSLNAYYISAITPDNFVFAVSTTFVQMCVIGGLGTLGGAVIGTLFVTFLPEIFRGLAVYRLGIGGFIMVVLMVVRPQGIAGSRAFAADFSIADRIRQAKIKKEQQRINKEEMQL